MSNEYLGFLELYIDNLTTKKIMYKEYKSNLCFSSNHIPDNDPLKISIKKFTVVINFILMNKFKSKI